MAPPVKPDVIRYVLIPVDPNQPIQELQVDQPDGKEVECLTNTMQKHYREQGVAASEEGKAAFAEQLKTKLPAGAELTEDMLTGAFGMQLVESVPLLSGGPHTGWIHVNMYCDDKGQMKSLAPNARAMGIAEACGKPTQVYGDVFMGRLYEDADDFVRLNFELKEVSSTAPWVIQAAMHNAKKAADGGAALQEFAERTGAQNTTMTSSLANMSAAREPELDPEAADPGDKAGAFTWEQSTNELVINVSCPKGTTAKQVKCVIKRTSLSLSVASLPEPTVFDGLMLFGNVTADECTWSIEDAGDRRLLTITLTKEKGMRWLDLKTATAS